MKVNTLCIPARTCLWSNRQAVPGIAPGSYVLLVSRLFMRYAYVGHTGPAICAGTLLRYKGCEITAAKRSRTGKEKRHAGTEEP